MSDRACQWPDCGKVRSAKGFCPKHYQRAKREGDYATPWLTWAPAFTRVPECRWPDCGTVKIEGRGLCKKHWLRASRMGEWEAPWDAWGKNICVGCGGRFTGRNNRQKHCSNTCAFEAWKRRNPERYLEHARHHQSRRRARKAATQIESFTDADVRALYGDDCYLCNQPIDFTLRWPDPLSPSLDHVVPLARDGTHTLENVAMTHLLCNNRKNASPAVGRPKKKETPHANVQ